ncbi:MAG: hypothetical protein HY078_11985 [Elusimicrobia bacterium]|nr:hypothetical protein [Elusimicrobiota bacterium]
MRRLILLAALLAACPAGAVFTKAEMDVIDPEPLLDSEYLLDLAGFSYPLDWTWEWEASSASAKYRGNGASLDCCSLFLEQEAALRRRLASWLEFRYDLRQQGDKELDDFHHWIALEAGPWKGASVGLFGEPTPAKEDSDIGLLLRYRPRPGLMVYALRDNVDWNFNHRGSSGQRYARVPLTYEAGGEIVAGPDRWRASIEWDLPLVRVDPAQNLAYAYRRTTATVRWSRPPAAGEGSLGWELLYRHEYKREGKAFDPDPTAASLDFRRSVHYLKAAAVVPLGRRDRTEAGLGFWERDSRTNVAGGMGDRRVKRWEAEPYARWLRRLAPWVESELGFFLGSGETRRDLPNSPSLATMEAPVNAKLDVGFDFLVAGNGRIGLRGSFDLDDASRHLWDGGNIRAQIFF